jgi:hypothetical protein
MVIITSIIVVLSLLFGGTGAVVVAAQGSLPGEGLYTLKLATEDVQYFADTIHDRYGKNFESLNLLTTTLDGDILLLEPVDGYVTRDQSINSDQGQSFGNQDPQAQNGEKNDPFYAETPGGADRAPSKTLNQSTDDYGSGPGVSGGHNNTSQYKGSKGTQSQDSGSPSEISP